MFRIVVAASLVLSPSTPVSHGDHIQAIDTPRARKEVQSGVTTYTDSRNGVSFRYPSAWKAQTQFGYVPAALAQSEQVKLIAGFGYEVGGFPREQVGRPYAETNLEGFGVVYAAVRSPNRMACESISTSISGTSKFRTVLMGSHALTVRKTASSGMMQSNSGTLYVLYLRPNCFFFETAIAKATASSETGRDPDAKQTHTIEALLLKVVKSVHFNHTEAPLLSADAP
ncbi:hypothetical protein Terro_3186 [Terriglobus roseus DSM 18391]|uniref:Uncharacterized protein n=1 Tax=Terriglobus roseus (strain DSM 18391 / NRRL B-41598 / KBS 63) TaxID=926566 RepID=I3ZJJ0_TERRK|nr:hypothetical protein Terro_3186 [Terriglobus roseus DSM 18391]